MLKGADRRLKKLTDHRLLVGGGGWESDKQRHYAEWAWKALGAALTEVREEAVRMLREDHPSKAVAPDLLRKRDDARQDALPKLKRSIDEMLVQCRRSWHLPCSHVWTVSLLEAQVDNLRAQFQIRMRESLAFPSRYCGGLRRTSTHI